MEKAYLIVNNVKKIYKITNKSDDGSILKTSQVIFKDLNFYAKSKETTLITGKSGCGKSTLLNYIATIDSEFEEGKLSIGESKFYPHKNKISSFFDDYKRATFRRHNIGFIFQSHMLLPDFTILENCLTPFIARGYINSIKENLSQKEFKERALIEIKKWFDIVELDYSNLYKYPNELSGGQQQRVAIIRGIVHKPKLLISDEPTASLDKNIAIKIISFINNFIKEHKICHIVVTHQEDLYENIKNAHYHFEKEGQVPAILTEVFRK